MKSFSLCALEAALKKDVKKLKSPRGFLWAGYPHYNTLFGRDSLISGWQMVERDPAIARAALTVLAAMQGKRINNKKEEEPGRILHEYRTKSDVRRWVKKFVHFRYWGFPYYGGCDSTPLFVIVTGIYFAKTRDIRFLKRLWPHVEQALEWLHRFGDRDGDTFIEYQRKNPHGLYHQGWRDSTENHLRIIAPVALAEIQGYAHRAYEEGAHLARILSENTLAKSLEKRAETLKKKFNKVFWTDGAWILALDASKQKINVPSSNQGHLLISDIIEGKRGRDALVKRLFENDLWTPYGIRTLSSRMPYFDPTSYHLGSIWPHDNWFIYKGLLRHGYRKEAHKIKAALFRAYRTFGHIPEYYGVKGGKIIGLPGCWPQAWASAALLDMMDDSMR